MESLFAVCAPGLEPIVAQELRDLGLQAEAAPRFGAGGVRFEASYQGMQRANLLLRCADRVLVRLGEFHAAAFSEFETRAGRLPWEKHLAPGRPVAFKVASRRSRLYHESAVALRLPGAIARRLGQLPAAAGGGEATAEALPQLIVISLEGDHCTVSVDSSGELLHRRGYRLATAKAPLRETLACAILKASGWDAASPLIDPFCGSGTIPIEAALLARRLPPGAARRFAFMDWPGFDRAAWPKLVAEKSAAPAVAPRIMASDRDAGAVRAARENAERAGVAGLIEFSCRAVSAIEPAPAPGWLVCNPPYGVRLRGKNDLRDLYAQLGKVLRAKCAGWRAALLCGDKRLLAGAGLGFETRLSTLNGGLKVSLECGTIPQASKIATYRRERPGLSPRPPSA